MEKTVSVKTESDTVKVAVITTENKIVTEEPPQSLSETNDIQTEDDVNMAPESQDGSLSLAQLSSDNQMRMK
jgi:hypothetical protein